MGARGLEPARARARSYKTIAALLDERRLDRQRYIEDVIAILARELAAAGVRAEITGRPKHIYSIWLKMRRKQTGIDSLYDIRAVRILVDDVKDCYAALGIVHHLWTPLPREFDDYIAKPKANDYRSLHTAVIGPEGKPLEVQIRTREMHQHSEYGVAAHWRYKEGAQRARGATPRSRTASPGCGRCSTGRMRSSTRPSGSPRSRAASSPTRSTCSRRKARSIDLPVGSTPVDFAYAVHTGLGHRCRGARVDGAMVPLNHPLKNGERVEIIAAKQGGPSRDWLNPELGYAHSHRARTKVRQWFKAQQHEETLAQGRAIIERELSARAPPR